MADLKKVISKASEFEKNQSVAMAKEFLDVNEKIDNIEIPEIPEQDNSDIIEAIEGLKEVKPDNSSLEKIMKEVADKKEPEAKEFPKSMDVNIKNQKEVKFPDVQKVEMSEPKWYDKFNYDTILTGIKSILEKITIKTKTEDILDVHILDKKGKIIDKFGGGKGTDVQHGGYFSGWLKNVLGTVINPATEDKQDDIITGLDEVEILKNRGTISTNNSTTTPLGVDEVFTGEADYVLDYGEVNILVKTDQDSAVGGLSIEFSPDGTNWDEKIPVNITAGRAESYGFGNRADYFRIVYTNGGTAQGYFRLHATFHPMRTRRGARCLCVDIDPAEFAPTRRCVIAAKKPDGTYENVHSTAGANLKVAVEESEVAFPIGAGSNGSRTLTTAATAYAIPTTASTKNHILILYNGSDTDMFVGYENSNANGILLATGGNMSFDLGISQQVYAYCASAGKVLTYSYKELNN